MKIDEIEGKEREDVRRRGEKMRGNRMKRMKNRVKRNVKGIVVMGYSSGGRDLEKVFLSDIANLGKGFLEVFVSFGDMVTGILGIKAGTKKSEIGKYFSDIEKIMRTTKAKLNEILEKNGQYEKVKTVVEQFISGTVDKIAEGAKEAAKGVIGGDAIGGGSYCWLGCSISRLGKCKCTS
ncbi:variable large family protein [Borrelia crocidurae]|uniref:Variable large protein n=1 Tax=Borrelia crocidurae (strain Achema) TaxID=1155096 RepID=I0FFD1_BORCA|nr:hypothetical protein Q7M_1189 [Borrelia crocidurae str. Achema]